MEDLWYRVREKMRDLQIHLDIGSKNLPADVKAKVISELTWALHHLEVCEVELLKKK